MQMIGKIGFNHEYYAVQLGKNCIRFLYVNHFIEVIKLNNLSFNIQARKTLELIQV